MVHSLFKEYHSCARSFSLLPPPLAFSLSRPARRILKKLLKKPLKLLLRTLRTPPVKPSLPPRKLLTPPPTLLVMLLLLLPVPLLAPLRMLLPLLRKLLLSNSRKVALPELGVRALAQAPFSFAGRARDGVAA